MWLTISLFFERKEKKTTVACTFIGWVPVIAKMVPGHQKVITERINGTTTITVREARKKKEGEGGRKKVEKKQQQTRSRLRVSSRHYRSPRWRTRNHDVMTLRNTLCEQST